jgi:hypothetical protein
MACKKGEYVECLLLLEAWSREECFGSMYEYIGSIAQYYHTVVSV